MASISVRHAASGLFRLTCVLLLYAIGFSVLCGLLSVLIYYVILAGLPESDRRMPVLVMIAVVLVLSLPFYARAICGFISGGHSFKQLLTGSLKMGRPLYLKYLVLCAAVYGLSWLIRLLPVTADLAVLQLILTAVVIILSLPLAYRIFKKDKDSADAAPKAATREDISESGREVS